MNYPLIYKIWTGIDLILHVSFHIGVIISYTLFFPLLSMILCIISSVLGLIISTLLKTMAIWKGNQWIHRELYYTNGVFIALVFYSIYYGVTVDTTHMYIPASLSIGSGPPLLLNLWIQSKIKEERINK
uniref:Uncharacterized protein n=1 Tax=Lepeophtheirus salmonis TaxID=72036 RepID=A0A0K2VC66_LEPSM